MKKILVTGANGQLGKCLKDLKNRYPEFEWTFTTKGELDISNMSSIRHYFERNSFDYVINTAAFTDVEGSETQKEKAFSVNAEGIKELAIAVANSNGCLIHISTDYVFDGEKESPYKENDGVNPLNVYGASKLAGEKYIEEYCSKHYILRTSWLYSQYGHNFFLSVLKWANEGRDMSITTEQIGSPTNANDLAEALVTVIKGDKEEYGIYHFSNEGKGTWFDFASEILRLNGQLDEVNLAKTDHYRTFAKRPKYSVLDNSKIQETFQIRALNWKASLKKLITTLKNNK
ncbi:MAG: dTDP-4-dehydrorhamnose reductase [Flavobacteriaceae bacterium]|nr:dTDP-4-dehydrorhamnose reductase [Flavobacteriaceae bacterium]